MGMTKMADAAITIWLPTTVEAHVLDRDGLGPAVCVEARTLGPMSRVAVNLYLDRAGYDALMSGLCRSALELGWIEPVGATNQLNTQEENDE